jgi:parallel beta-helix repeat protein
MLKNLRNLEGNGLERKLVLMSVIVILLTNLLGMAIEIEKVKASGTIYIRADGRIDPSTANITSVNNVTYTFTGNNYDEIVVDRNNIVVDGAGYTLQGTGSGSGIAFSGRSNITLRNIEINTFSIGIYIHSSSDNTVSGNNITNNGNGIVILSSSSNNTVSGNNIIDNNFYGIVYLYSSFNNTLSGNNITNSDTGVYLYASSNNTISGNNITNNDWYGVYLHNSCNNNTVSGNSFVNDGLVVYHSFGNTVVDNLVDGKPLVYLEDISNLVVEDAGQVILVNCNRIRVENLTLSNTSMGVQLSNTNSTTITGNNITNSRIGVFLQVSSNNTVSGNSFVNDGLYVIDSFGNTVVDNLVNDKPLVYLEDISDLVVEDAGQVILVNCNRIRVENLTLSNTSVGAQLWNTNSTTITDNDITGNVEGVFLHSSSSNTISGNNITDNGIGSRFYSSSNDNTVYNNNFINNQQVLLSSSVNNKWDNGCEGNFWSDFVGTDSNGDGIGDTPYIIDGSNQDNYPLMNPYWNPADINHDLKVDIFDVVTACVAYSSTPSDVKWNPHCDIAEPYGVIDIFDIVMICSSYGEEY